MSAPIPAALASRLYLRDPLLVRFEARVVGHGMWGDKPSLLLEQSAFYPEAGGQLGDQGELDHAGVRLRVVDAQVDDAGRVHHLLEEGANLPAAGTEITGHVDRARRRVHMALHTGQHMLSRALLTEGGAATVSARLGETACTIDLGVPKLGEQDVAKAEALVNAVIDDDVIIRAYFPSEAELAGLSLRRAPKVASDVRVVDIEGFDVSPCGGTHCLRSAQVGLVKVTGLERYKGNLRLTFTAGARARRELGQALDELTRASRELSAPLSEVTTALGRVRAETATERARAGRLARELGELIGADLARGAGDSVITSVPGANVELLRAVAGAITKAGKVALLAGQDDGACPLVFSRPSGSAFDCGKALKAVAQAAGGRGGGRPEHAEGRAPESRELAGLMASVAAASGPTG